MDIGSKYLKYRPENLIFAINAVQRRKMTPLVAATKFKIPSQVLYHKLAKIGSIVIRTQLRKNEERALAAVQNKEMTIFQAALKFQISSATLNDKIKKAQLATRFDIRRNAEIEHLLGNKEAASESTRSDSTSLDVRAQLHKTPVKVLSEDVTKNIQESFQNITIDVSDKKIKCLPEEMQLTLDAANDIRENTHEIVKRSRILTKAIRDQIAKIDHQQKKSQLESSSAVSKEPYAFEDIQNALEAASAASIGVELIAKQFSMPLQELCDKMTKAGI